MQAAGSLTYLLRPTQRQALIELNRYITKLHFAVDHLQIAVLMRGHHQFNADFGGRASLSNHCCSLENNPLNKLKWRLGWNSFMTKITRLLIVESRG